MHFLNRLLMILIALVVVVFLLGLFMPKLRQQQGMTQREDDLKKQIDAQKALLAQRTREVDLLKNDRGYVETLARDRLDMMKEGETIIRIESQQATPTPTPGRTRTHAATQ